MTAVPKIFPVRDRAYLDHLREQQCILSFQTPCDPAHIRWDGDYRVMGGGGMSQKPSDCYAVSLAPNLHQEQHAQGEVAFWSDAFAIEGFRMWLLKDWARLKYEEWKRGCD